MVKTEELLRINDLTIEYQTDEGTVYAVNHVNLHLDKGKTLGLIGETGAGKTTIARAILRILQSPPGVVKSGEIRLEGKDLLQLHENEMRRLRGSEIAMIFQDPMSALNPVITVGEQISESIRIHQKISRKDAVIKGMDMLETVGIPRERYYNYPHEFSGGMKQRVIIAMALACNPQLLLADEPTTALDVTIQAQVLDLMKGLKEKYGTSMIFITHDLGVAAAVCDHLAVIYGGRVMEYGSREQIFLNARHPYTKGLFSSLPDVNSEERLQPIPGQPLNPMDEPIGCPFAARCHRATEECCRGTVPVLELDDGHQISCLHTEEEGGAAV